MDVLEYFQYLLTQLRNLDLIQKLHYVTHNEADFARKARCFKLAFLVADNR